MADTGWVVTGNGYNWDLSGTDWTNPSNIESDDSFSANVFIPTSGSADGLRAASFSFDIPTGATIDGVEVEMIGYYVES